MYGAARVCKGINLREREAYATVPNRQVVEKLYEYRQKGFLVFIDLKKAYDSVNRDCMWAILKKAGVPPALINIIRSFHDSMTASLPLPDVEVDHIDVRNGLRQGCCMAPVSFNIFMWAVFQLWTRAVEEFDDVGVHLCYGSGGALLFKKGDDGLAT